MAYKDPDYEKEYKRRYYERNKERYKIQGNINYQKNKEKRKEQSSRYYYENDINFTEKRRRDRKEYRQRIKRKSLSIIDPNLKCARCGCDDLRMLEKNHKNGGGNKECRAKGQNTISDYDIIRGIRKVDDLEILCRPCNHIHFLEKKIGQVTGLSVVWRKPIDKIKIEKIWESVAI